MIRPLGNRVSIRVDKSEEKTKGGIIMPDCAKEEKATGKVVGIGRDVTDIEHGDIVMFGKFSGDIVIQDGTEYRLVSEDDILAKLVTK